MDKHKQVRVYNPIYETEVEVDQGIAALLEKLWAAGIETANSCEENQPGIVWIEFGSSRDVESFLSLAAPTRRGKLYHRILDGWEFSPCVDDIAYKLRGEEIVSDGPPQFLVTISVRFPKTDYQRILKNIGGIP